MRRPFATLVGIGVLLSLCATAGHGDEASDVGINALRDALNSPYETDRYNSVEALGYLANRVDDQETARSIVRQLTAASEDQSEDIQRAVPDAMGRFVEELNPGSVQRAAISELLGRPEAFANKTFDRVLVLQLARIANSDASVAALVEENLSVDDWDARFIAAEIVDSQVHAGEGMPLPGDVLTTVAMQALRKTDDRDVRRRAVRLLATTVPSPLRTRDSTKGVRQSRCSKACCRTTISTSAFKQQPPSDRCRRAW